MKKVLLYLTLLTLSVSCSSNDDELSMKNDENVSAVNTLAIKPYSYDVTLSGITLVYHISGASMVEVLYKEQSSTIWNKANTEIVDDVLTVNLTDLRQRSYYNVLVIVHNESGESVTDTQIIQFDYEAVRGTYFMQPYLIWGTPLVNAKKALTDAGNIIDNESIVGGDYIIECRFKYKELKTEYLFDTEQKLKEVIICFERERASVEELRRFISNALGYLAYGNIHVIMNEKEFTFPLYKTSEGSSYVFIYELDNSTIVDYISSSNINLSEKLIK